MVLEGFRARKLGSGTEKQVPNRFPNFCCARRRPWESGKLPGRLWGAPWPVRRWGRFPGWDLVSFGGSQRLKTEVPARKNRFSVRIRFFSWSLSTSLRKTNRLGASRPLRAPSHGTPLVPPGSGPPQVGRNQGIEDNSKDNDLQDDCRLILPDTTRLPVPTNFGNDRSGRDEKVGTNTLTMA